MKSGSIYFTTRDASTCPVGLQGAYDRDEDDSFDPTFPVECHTESVSQECCDVVNVTSAPGAAVNRNQSIYLGQYSLEGAVNGHPVYHMRKFEQFDCFLYYRKEGMVGLSRPSGTEHSFQATRIEMVGF